MNSKVAMHKSICTICSSCTVVIVFTVFAQTCVIKSEDHQLTVAADFPMQIWTKLWSSSQPKKKKHLHTPQLFLIINDLALHPTDAVSTTVLLCLDALVFINFLFSLQLLKGCPSSFYARGLSSSAHFSSIDSSIWILESITTLSTG